MNGDVRTGVEHKNHLLSYPCILCHRDADRRERSPVTTAQVRRDVGQLAGLTGMKSGSNVVLTNSETKW